jgi:hypothetical protein
MKSKVYDTGKPKAKKQRIMETGVRRRKMKSSWSEISKYSCRKVNLDVNLSVINDSVNDDNDDLALNTSACNNSK